MRCRRRGAVTTPIRFAGPHQLRSCRWFSWTSASTPRLGRSNLQDSHTPMSSLGRYGGQRSNVSSWPIGDISAAPAFDLAEVCHRYTGLPTLTSRVNHDVFAPVHRILRKGARNLSDLCVVRRTSQLGCKRIKYIRHCRCCAREIACQFQRSFGDTFTVATAAQSPAAPRSDPRRRPLPLRTGCATRARRLPWNSCRVSSR